MTAELILTRGLPASGKTTWAREWVDAAPESRARVNRDDLRLNLFGKVWLGGDYRLETSVTAAQHGAVEQLLRSGVSVVVDDTHIRWRYVNQWRGLAEGLGVEVLVNDEFCDVDVEECIRRDQERERSVGETAIRRMHQQLRSAGRTPPRLDANETYIYEPDPTKPPAFIFDLDGTLARMDGRSPYDWSRVGDDLLVDHVAQVASELSQRFKIVVLSGRDGSCRETTEAWLDQHEIVFDRLVMRPEGDSRKDSIVKLELFREKVAPNYHVQAAFDDRDQVVRMWRAIGLPCYQVAEGSF